MAGFDPAEALERRKRNIRAQARPAFDPVEALERRKSNTEKTQDFLGAEFDAENFADSSLRVSLSRGDTLEEKRLRLQKRYPQGEIQAVGPSVMTGIDQSMLVWRESPQAQWKRIEPPGFDFTDVVESVAPSAESIAAETGAALMSKGATTIPRLVGKLATFAGLGEAAEQGVQTARGVQSQSLLGQAGEAFTEAGLSAAGGFAASPLVAARNVLGGRGALQVGDEGLEALEAAGRLDARLQKGMTPGLVSDNPAIQASEEQARVLLPGLNRRYQELMGLLDRAVRGQIDDNSIGRVVETVGRSMDELSEQFISTVGRNNTPLGRGGRALQQGIREYDEGARALVDDLYGLARQIEEPQFDFVPLQSLAQDLRAGSKGLIDPNVEKLLAQLESIEGPIPLSDGVLSVTDQLRNIRTAAFDLKQVPLGGVATQATGQANDLFRAITDVLDNPLNTNAGFKRAWSEASKQAGQRHSTLERAVIREVAKSENPTGLVARYAKPKQADNLATLRLTVSREKWDEFVGAWEAELLRSPDRLNSTLKSFDKETLDVLLPRNAQKQWFKLGTEMDRIYSVGLDKIVEQQISNRNVVDALIRSGKPRDANTLIRAFNTSHGTSARNSIRAAILDWAWDGVVEKTKSGLKINAKKLASNVEILKRNGFYRMLPEEVQQTIGDAEIVGRLFARQADMGASLRRMEAVSGAGRLQRGALTAFLQSGIISHFYMSNAGRKILIGSGMPNSKGQVIRLMTAAATQTATPTDIQALIAEDQQGEQ